MSSMAAIPLQGRIPTYAAAFERRSDAYDRAIEWLLAGLLGFAPLAFGGVEAWSEQVILCLCAALSGVFLVKLVRCRDATVLWHWTYVPLAAFLLVAVVQVLPLPSRAVALVSPDTVSTKTRLLGDLPEAQRALDWMTLSFYEWATAHDLRLVFAVAMVFLVVVNTYKRPAQIKRLLAAVSAIGGGVILLALAQDVLGNGRLYWSVPTYDGRANSGPFINHSHYAQFVNASIGAALGLALVRVKENWRERRPTAGGILEYLRSPEARHLLAPAAMVVLGAVTVFLSLSRGGVLSMVIAAGFTTAVMSHYRPVKNHGWVLVAIALMAFIGVLYLGFDAIYDRLAALEDLRQAQDGRRQILRDIAVMWTRFPLLGTGLGTHAVVYPMFDQSTNRLLAGHAENEYAQLAEETGLLGLASLAVFGVLVWRCWGRLVRRPAHPIGFAAYGLGFALAAVSLHSLSDFGQHVPANAVLSAVFCALLVNLDRLNRVSADGESRPRSSAASMSRRARLGLGICVSIVWLWCLPQANRARVAEGHWSRAVQTEAHVQESEWQGSDAVYADLISQAARAADLQPGNITYRHWLNVYRWRSISRRTGPDGRIALTPGARKSAERIVRDLREAIPLCPTFGPAWCVLGQLEDTVLGEPQGLTHIRRSLELAPNDPTVCLVAGLTDAGNGALSEGLARLARAVQLDDRLYGEVAHICVHDLNAAEFAVGLAEGKPHRLTLAARLLSEAGLKGELAEDIRVRLVEQLEMQCHSPEAPAASFAALGHVHRDFGNHEAAIHCYREALARDYACTEYHLELARQLAAAGAITEAVHEARVCLRLRPAFRPAQRLIEELSLHLPTVSSGVGPDTPGLP